MVHYYQWPLDKTIVLRPCDGLLTGTLLVGVTIGGFFVNIVMEWHCLVFILTALLSQKCGTATKLHTLFRLRLTATVLALIVAILLLLTTKTRGISALVYIAELTKKK